MTGGLHVIAIAAAATLSGGLAAGSYHLGLRTIRDQTGDTPINSTSLGRWLHGQHERGPTTLAGLVGASATALSVWRVTVWHLWPTLAVLFGIGAALAMLDAGYRRLPRRLTTPAYLLTVALLTLASALAGTWWPLARAGITSVAFLVSFTLLALLAPGAGDAGGIGGGDIVLTGLIGLALGWLDPRRAIAAIVAGFLLAAIITGVRIARRRADRHTRIPLGPYLLFGTVLALCVPG